MFAFINMVYWLILVHGLILMLGGAYTYARVPLGFWMQNGSDLPGTITTRLAISRKDSSLQWVRVNY